MSQEELKPRAAEKNKAEEEQKRKDLEARDRAMAEQSHAKVVRAPVVTQSMREAKEPERVEVPMEWGVDLRR